MKVRTFPLWVFALVLACVNLLSHILGWTEGHSITKAELTSIVIWFAIVPFVGWFLEGNITLSSKWKDDPTPKENSNDSKSA